MTRTTMILVVILAVVVIGGGAYLWMNKGTLSWPGSTTTNTNAAVVTNTTANTNAVNLANANLSIPDTLKGDQVIDKTISIAGADVHFTSSLRATKYNNVNADAGTSFIIIYFDGLPGASVMPVNQALTTTAHLVNGTKTIALGGLKTASNLIKNDRGYLKFTVPTAAKNLQLEIGSGASAQRIALTS